MQIKDALKIGFEHSNKVKIKQLGLNIKSGSEANIETIASTYSLIDRYNGSESNPSPLKIDHTNWSLFITKSAEKEQRVEELKQGHNLSIYLSTPATLVGQLNAVAELCDMRVGDYIIWLIDYTLNHMNKTDISSYPLYQGINGLYFPKRPVGSLIPKELWLDLGKALSEINPDLHQSAYIAYLLAEIFEQVKRFSKNEI
ncbi:hypothetical protein ACI3E1_07130 [Ligilactobacillus sp. LYQ139]|uniref:hypothetical protein n=1 Tax=Ligilactobacillus sp. LYQ139 TaxID=3378800 RepID=UPI0038534229